LKSTQPNIGLFNPSHMKTTLLILALLSLAFCNYAQTLTIEFTNIRSTKGQLLLGVYTNQTDYANKKAIKKQTVLKTKIVNGKVTATIEGLTPGTYGIALLDDEDFDKEMAYGLFLPKEGFAFSNYYHTGMSKPTFDDFDFVLGKEDKKIVMKLKYL